MTNDNLISIVFIVVIDICNNILVDMHVKQYHKCYQKLDKVVQIIVVKFVGFSTVVNGDPTVILVDF